MIESDLNIKRIKRELSKPDGHVESTYSFPPMYMDNLTTAGTYIPPADDGAQKRKAWAEAIRAKSNPE